MHAFALKPKTTDPRDFSHAKVYGAVDDLSSLPPGGLGRTPSTIKEQKASDYCSTEAGTSVSEDQELVELCELWQFMVTKQIAGDPQAFGAELRDMAKSFTKYGSIEKKDSLYTIDTPRSIIVDPEQWNASLYAKALIHRKASFFAADGPHDTFDNFRSTLALQEANNATIVTGVYWRQSWDSKRGGIIPDTLSQEDQDDGTKLPHAIKIFDWTTLYGNQYPDGKLYLKAQLSNGKDQGDKGIFYIPRSVANRDFDTFGSILFTDLDPKDADYYLKYGISINDNTIVAILKRIQAAFLSLITLLALKRG